MHRFARALQTGTLVSDASRQKLWMDHSGTGYGYGFSIEDGAADPVAGQIKQMIGRMTAPREN